ncbi:MAG: hypothetical protein IKS32_05540 [Solobacterium sp.]|nr:hypothetical protein [Solobacterium sp.]
MNRNQLNIAIHLRQQGIKKPGFSWVKDRANKCLFGFDDYFTFRKTSIRNKENGNPHQGTHQSATRNASIRARNALADGGVTE